MLNHKIQLVIRLFSVRCYDRQLYFKYNAAQVLPEHLPIIFLVALSVRPSVGPWSVVGLAFFLTTEFVWKRPRKSDMESLENKI